GGRSGGFCLGREPERITLLQVMTALGGPIIDPDHCARFSGRREVCVHQDDCSVHHVLDTLAAYIADILGRTTLQDLVARSAGRPAGPGLIGAEQLLGGAAATTDITPRPAEIDGLARDTQSQQSL
nr:Rrf2 family transcriptional regulator [candidate division Zixibacteria bacterium]